MAKRATLGASELASLLVELCLTGIEHRRNGRCLGTGVLERCEWRSDGIRWIDAKRWWRAHRRAALARRHALTGHARGCNELGVALSELERVAIAYDAVAAAEYLLDHVRLAVATVEQQSIMGVSWSAADATEILETFLARAITRKRRAASSEEPRPA